MYSRNDRHNLTSQFPKTNGGTLAEQIVNEQCDALPTNDMLNEQ
jgi:hypothetical protein